MLSSNKCEKELKNKVKYEIIAQKYGFVINRIAQNDYKIIRLNKIRKSEGIQLVIDYLHNENKNLLNLLK